MEASISIGELASFKLTKALLIYSAETRDGVFASKTQLAVTAHDINTKFAQPVIEPGQPVTYAAVEALATALGRNLSAGFLPPNILSVGFGQVAWFCPAERRRLWFKPDGRFNGGPVKDDSETARAMRLNGKFAHHPPLLFIARDSGLSVFALAENRRPEAHTKIFRAPYWNLWDTGKLCEGNRRLAKFPVPASIPAYEDGFFNSAFSHTNIKKVCTYPGGHAALWQELAKRKTAPDAKFWPRALVPLNRAVSDVITAKETQ